LIHADVSFEHGPFEDAGENVAGLPRMNADACGVFIEQAR
jgi:hypothetical protein